jgi:amino acid transporter
MAQRSGPSATKPGLGLLGVTMNAMALIAPGAFLWITYQLQAAATAPDGTSVASDIWAGLALALLIALLTAVSYGQLARLYPDVGFGSAYAFAERAFLERERREQRRFARAAKLVTGWAAHLFYSVYPGIMVAMLALLFGWLYHALTGGTLSTTTLVVLCALFATLTGWIAAQGIARSTRTSIVSNVVQLGMLVVFSALAIAYRLTNPAGATHWAFHGAWDVVRPHSVTGVAVQSTIAMLILVGFESCTALAAESANPRRDIPRAVVLSLVIQGLLAYMVGYFAAGFVVSEKLLAMDGSGSLVAGMAAAAASNAPIGDMAVLVGNGVLGGVGFALMLAIAAAVVLAALGSTLSCLNTAARVTCAMAQDGEMPSVLHATRHGAPTPQRAIWTLVALSTVIGAIGVQSVVGLTGIALASNLGTFVLYALTCAWTIVAFADRRDRHLVKHYIVPGLGLLANVLMLLAILYLYVGGNEDSRHEAYICFAIAGGWAVLGALYAALRGTRTRGPILAGRVA